MMVAASSLSPVEDEETSFRPWYSLSSHRRTDPAQFNIINIHRMKVRRNATLKDLPPPIYIRIGLHVLSVSLSLVVPKISGCRSSMFFDACDEDDDATVDARS